MSTITTVDARNQFSDILNRAAYGREHVVLTRRGKEIAALIPMEHLQILEQVLAKLEDDLDLAEALRVLDDEGDEVLEWEEVARDL
ncbi:MAG: type II toxin-antitoxin system Phd/YefM family antitoxin [Bacteroidota bacterium]